MGKYRKIPKREPRFVDRKCPQCVTGDLVYRFNKTIQQDFIGCSNYPNCTYSETPVDYDDFSAKIYMIIKFLDNRWGYKPDYKLINFFRTCGSGQEIKFLLGALHYLDFHENCRETSLEIELIFRTVSYDGMKYDAIVIPKSYYYYEYGPSSLAIISQFEFCEKYHHDFCILASDDRNGVDNSWRILTAVEVDFHPSHIFCPSEDEFRDFLISYPIIRLTFPESQPLKWFGQALSYW